MIRTQVTGLRALLPPSVEVEQWSRDVEPSEALLAPESRHVEGAVASRRAEFATVRACARLAMGRLGVPDAAGTPIVPGRDRAPAWPPGVVGAITHCEGVRAAAVAREGTVASLGIDAEPAEPLSGDVLDLVATRRERAELRGLARERPDVPWARVLFSAKESVFKAWYPLTRAWLGFDECEVDFGVDAASTGNAGSRAGVRSAVSGTFDAFPLMRGLAPDGRVLGRFRGRWAIDAGAVLTAVVVPAAGAAGIGAAEDRCG
ncbi:MAG: 4'-phosphopantetheinyl transferase family protein [Pseudoclavibacter sp.]